jgi:hypothetical protein
MCSPSTTSARGTAALSGDGAARPVRPLRDRGRPRAMTPPRACEVAAAIRSRPCRRGTRKGSSTAI